MPLAGKEATAIILAEEIAATLERLIWVNIANA
jgi:hypothetical protein